MLLFITILGENDPCIKVFLSLLKSIHTSVKLGLFKCL